MYINIALKFQDFKLILKIFIKKQLRKLKTFIISKFYISLKIGQKGIFMFGLLVTNE